MALLTDPSGLRGKPFQILVNKHKVICIFLYLASIVWYLLLASDQINNATYLSENALLPGLVIVGSDLSKDAKELLHELEDKILPYPSMPEAWLKSKFREAFVESYTQNFTLSGSFGKYSGKNVYGIIRGGGSSNEAIVISVPYRSEHSPHETTAPGLALILAITKYFRRQKYWAKDLILLVTEHEQVGMQAWLEGYHGVTCGTGVLKAGELEGRGGAIQAAINLELHSDRIKNIDVKLVGLNGQLPNLDLVNLVLRMCSKERVRHSFSNKEKIHNMPSWEQWQHSLVTMTSMVLTQASGVPDGNHGLFHRFGIEAVTMEGHAKIGNGPHVTLHHIGRVIEGLFRSINNLLERFHQSYFFYLLADTDRFISIGLYMPCIGMLVAALFIRAFSLHVSLRLRQEAGEQEEMNMGGTCAMFLVGHAVGALADISPRLATTWAPLSVSTRTSITSGYILVSFLSLLAPFVVFKRFKDCDWTVLHLSCLVYIGTLLLSVGMSNFSLALLAGLALTPGALLMYPSSNRFWKIPLWLALHPLSLLFVSVVLTKLFYGMHTISSLEALGNSLLLASFDSQIYGPGPLHTVCLFYLSIWICLAPSYQKDKPHAKTD